MSKRETVVGHWGMHLAMAIGLALSGIGCGGGDSGGATAIVSPVVGAWELVDETTDGVTVSAQSMAKTEVLIFDADSEWIRVTVQNGTTVVQEGSWSVSGTTLTLTPVGKPTSTYTFNVNGNILAFSSETISHTFGFTFVRK